MLKEKEASATQPEAKETVQAAAVEQEIQETQEEPEQVVSFEERISPEARKMLSDKTSFMDKLKQAESVKESEGEETEIEEEELEEIEAKAEPVKVEFEPIEIEDRKFESIESVKEYLAEVAEERKTLEAEKQEIQNFVERVSDPDLVEVLKFVNEGYSFPVALVKAGMDESIFDLENLDEPNKEALVRAKIERENAAKEAAKQQKKLEANMQQSNKALSEFQTEEGFDDKVKTDLVGLMSKVHSELLNGLVTKETLTIFAKGLNYEKALSKAKEEKKAAEEAGRIQGRNEKIAIEMKRKDTGGVPALGNRPEQPRVIKKNPLAAHVNIPANSFMERIKQKQSRN